MSNNGDKTQKMVCKWDNIPLKLSSFLATSHAPTPALRNPPSIKTPKYEGMTYGGNILKGVSNVAHHFS